MNAFDTPFIVPVAALALVAVGVVAGAVSRAHARRLKADQRMAMVSRGMKAEEIALLLDQNPEELEARSAGDAILGMASHPMRKLQSARRIGIIFCSIGIGAILFFVSLAHIVGDHEVYSGAAAALIPLAIGVGFFIDYRLQKRDFEAMRAEMKQSATV